MSRRVRCVLLVLTLGPTVAFGQRKLDEAAVTAAAKEAMSAFQAPGLAVAVVQGDESLVQGFGVRELGREAPVTPDTIFALASLTKAFTATAVGLLVDDGKAGWDDPVRKHLDWFRLKDPLADRDVTLRDLLCHRTGLARHDLLWYHASWPIEESVRRMAQLEPAHPFRARYEYNNLAFAAAGLAVSKTAGKPWGEFIRERIFTPLGMKTAVFTATEAKARADHATPHRRAGDKQTVISWYPDEKQVRASGSIKASARDLVPWLRMQLGGGALDGKRIISAASLAETHRPQIVVRLSPGATRRTESTQASYGLGWSLRDYRGWGLVEHGGANDGFRGRIVLVPKAKFGLAILTNTEEGEMVEALGHRLLDEALGLKPKEWLALARKRQTPPRKPPTPKPGTKPSRELAAYVGQYHDDGYGELVIEDNGKGLSLAWSSFRVSLGHFHYDTFQVKAKDEANRRMNNELATFALDESGDVASVRFLGRTFRRAPG